jgi:pimeloyl-ACP methyl ester carboxylesterase
MSTFILIHGGGDGGWSWHLVAAELRARGHDVVAPDLPAGDDALTLEDYADAVVTAVADTGARRQDVIVVGHSFGGFTAPLVAARLHARMLVLLAAMIPTPGESPDQWWESTGCGAAIAEASARDGGLTGNEDPFVSFYADVPRDLTEEAMRRERAHPSSAAGSAVWSLPAWPEVPTRFLLCRDDRFFPAEFFRRLVPERLGITPDEIPWSHCVALSRPGELADRLEQYAASAEPRLAP